MTSLETSETFSMIDHDIKFYFIEENVAEELVYESNKGLMLKIVPI